jgi:hypothetical protein
MTRESSVFIPAIDFFKEIAEPCAQEFLTDPNSLRKLVVAVWALASQVEHVCWENRANEMERSQTECLASLANEVPSYSIIKEAAESLKHAKRTKRTAATRGSASISFDTRGWGQAEYSVDEWGGSPVAFVHYVDGRKMRLKASISELLIWIQKELSIQATDNKMDELLHTNERNS